MSKHARRPGAAPAAKPDDMDDAFIGRLIEISAWAQRNTQTLIIGVIATALLVAGVVYYFNFRTATADRAVTELERIQQSVGLVSTQESVAELNGFIERFSGTPSAWEARLIIGELQLESGDPEGAIAGLQPVTRNLDDPVALQAAVLLAVAYEQTEQWDQAVATYLQIADRAELGFQIRGALSDAARIREQQGQHGDAARILDRLLGELEDADPGRGIVEMRLAEARARARQS